jgi:two-component system, NarL family, sensor histidine kinase UhpB
MASICCVYSLVASAQSSQEIDSLKQVLKTQLSDTARIYTLVSLSNCYQLHYPDSSLAFAKQALGLAEKLQYDEGIFWSVVGINNALVFTGNYPLELDYAFRALSLSKKINKPLTTGYANGMLSDYHYNLSEYSTSLVYWRKVVKIIEHSFPDDLYSAWGGLARIFDGMNQTDSAMFYAKKSYNRMKVAQHPNAYEVRAALLTYTLLGNVYASKSDYDSALFFYWKSIAESPPLHLDVNTIDCYNGLASVYKATGKLDSSVFYARKIIVSRTARFYPTSQLKAANLLSDIYARQNAPDSTLKYLRMATGLKDSLFNREKMLAIHGLLYKEQEKQQEIKSAEMKLENQFTIYFLLAAFIILLVVAGIVLKVKRQTQLQNMRNSIADDLHDDIGSTLSSISIMSELAKAKSPDSLSLLESIGESTVTIQENMSDIVWAIKSGNDRFENVVQRMNQFAAEILEAKNIELDFKSDPSLSASRLSMEQRKNVYLFFKEAVNNAVKYAGAKKISIDLRQKGHLAEMNICDDGRGFDTTKTFNGNGMNSLKKRAAELKGSFKIVSGENEGTVVGLTFKIT